MHLQRNRECDREKERERDSEACYGALKFLADERNATFDRQTDSTNAPSRLVTLFKFKRPFAYSMVIIAASNCRDDIAIDCFTILSVCSILSGPVRYNLRIRLRACVRLFEAI